MPIKNLPAYLTSKKAIFIIIILGTIVFFNGLFNNFVGDDNSQIVDNIFVHSIKNISTFFGGSTFFNYGAQQGGVYYKPLLNTLFSFIYTLFGPNPFFFHLVQVILHILNTCILFLLYKRFFSSSTSLFISLIFLVHPINSEAVFNISSTQEVLFFFFGITAMVLLSRFRSFGQLGFAGLLMFLSLLSKETGILFLLMSITYAFIFIRKYFLPVLGLSISGVILYSLLRINAVGISTNPLNAPITSINLMGRILNMPAMIFFYLKTFVFPLNLASSYHWVIKQVNFNQFFLPLTILILITIVLVFFAHILFKRSEEKYFKSYLFFCVWFISGLLLHLQIIPLDATVAERWFYFPIVGLLGMIGVFLEMLPSKIKRERLLVVFIAIILLFSTRTFIRSFDWRNEFSLATHDIKVSPESFALENLIAKVLIDSGNFQEAKIYAEKSIELYPYVTNYINLGIIFLDMGDYQKAKESYLKALQFGDYYLVYENLAGLSLVYGEAEENINFIKSALQKFPQSSRLWLFLAILEYSDNNIENAKIAIRQAYKYDQSSQVSFVYNTIMKNQPLKLKYETVK
ncbi:MAG: glycosyltransferase family 39 protein [Patescibacteria group bacterium]